MGRLALPWQLIRLAIKSAEMDDAIRIAGAPYAAAVTIVLSEGVRRLLRLRPPSEIARNSVLDDDDVNEAEALVELVGVCRLYASELAISEMTLRTCSELQQYLDTGTQALLDSLRGWRAPVPPIGGRCGGAVLCQDFRPGLRVSAGQGRGPCRPCGQ